MTVMSIGIILHHSIILTSHESKNTVPVYQTFTDDGQIVRASFGGGAMDEDGFRGSS